MKSLPLVGLNRDKFWQEFEQLLLDFVPRNRELIDSREELQQKIDEWHRTNEYDATNLTDYKSFLESIGYLKQSRENFSIETVNVDKEVKSIAGPQLVVPLQNARFTLNAANARWGSLYDALYGTDVIPNEEGEKQGYDPDRGQKVIAYGRDFLDKHFPLKNGSHHDASSYQIDNGAFLVTLNNEFQCGLKIANQCLGFTGSPEAPKGILLTNNDLHIEIHIDKESNIGKTDKAGVADISLESAVTTIVDCEDSVACVDVDDKLEVYRNWFGLMKGDLEAKFLKGGKELTRSLNTDRVYTSINTDKVFAVSGRSLLFIRNVGHLMNSDMCTDQDGNELPEGIIDGVVTSLISLIDLNKTSEIKNSREGSIYIVKPKMHGPDEVQFTCDLFSRIEQMLGLDQNVIKLGIMDEERRTTVNLKECLHVAKQRVVFINTGFLDRTGDEIHTSMYAGAFLPKAEIKQQAWISAYENWNVDIGLMCGLKGKAQIGKGMWPMPDEMQSMMEQKTGHPLSGANTAWVPSPTAATLHAVHYHQISVKEQQTKLLERQCASLDDILTIPLMNAEDIPNSDDITLELENNAQGILGYVVRWG